MAAQRSKLSRLAVLLGLLVLVGGVALLQDRGSAGTTAPCDVGTEQACAEVAPDADRSSGTEAAPFPVLNAESACRDVGYLCADLRTADRIQLRRWRDFSGTIVVHVPRPDFEDSGDAARLQEAAARGLRAWNGQPFAILTDLRGDREAHFAVRWSPGLSGTQIGRARTQWSSPSGLSVVAIELSSRNPFRPERLNDARQVQLTAAHEMGHALGVPHSDSERDIMYPTNTASSMSARDYRTMEALYEREDGTEIVK
jgi:predicted Zn-dependent protease